MWNSIWRASSNGLPLLAGIALLLFSNFASAQSSGGFAESAERLTQRLVALHKRLQHTTPEAALRLTSELQETALQRKILITKLIEDEPQAALRLAVPAHVRSAMPSLVQESIEEWQEIAGELEVVYEDYEDGSARLRHYIRKADKRVAVFFNQSPKGLKSGMTLHAQGLALDGAIVLETDEELLKLAADGSADNGTNGGFPAPVPNTFGVQRTAALLVNFTSLPEEPWTVAEAQAAVFGSASDFFQENSYGQSWLEGDVFGWLTIDVDFAGCPTTDIAIEAQRIAGSQGIDLSNYSRIIYAFPDIGCPFSGEATVGGSPSHAWMDGTLLDSGVLTHELGHNFGLYHSHALECTDDVVRDSCPSAEYGDALDRMGMTDGGHFNAFQKSRLGWLGSAESPTILTAESTGLYELEALASDTGGAKALRILRNLNSDTGAPDWYYLEYRQAVGYDSYLVGSRYGPSATNGLVFHQGTDGDGNSSQLLDMTPNSQKYDWDDLALEVGIAYTDDNAGMTVALEQIDGGRATVSVDFGSGTGGCVRYNPTVALSPSTGPWVDAGTAVDYEVTLTNNDSGSCPAGEFILSAVADSDWRADLENSIMQVGPGESARLLLTIISPAAAVDGFYDINLAVSHIAAPSYNAGAIATYVVDNAATPAEDTQAPTVPTGLSAEATRKQVNLGWSASTDNVGVAGYRVWRDGVVIAITTDTSYTDRDLASSTLYEYRVEAYDAANNASGVSNAVIAGKNGGGNSSGGGGGKSRGKK